MPAGQVRVSVRVTFFFSAYSRASDALPFAVSTMSSFLSRMRTGAALATRVKGAVAPRSFGIALTPAAFRHATAACQ